MKLRINQEMVFSLAPAAIFILSCLATSTSAEANVSTVADHPPLFGKPPLDQSQLLLLPVQGNVYPLGYFHVTIPFGVGQSRESYVLDPDRGSDLHLDAHLRAGQCEHPEECCYKIQYLDGSSSRGVLVRDALTFGHLVGEQLFLGCGYDQQSGPGGTVPLDNLLALSRGGLGITSQLHHGYGIGNVTGHCLSGAPNGKSFVFLGQHSELVNLRCLTCHPMQFSPTLRAFYSIENARLYYGTNRLEPNGMFVIFDTGSTYTHLMTPAFRDVLQKVDQGLQGEFIRASDDKTLPHCWKLNGQQRVANIVAYTKMCLKPLSFGFADGKSHVIPAESYLIQLNWGKLCLGLFDGGLQNHNIVGDISLQGKLVVFDDNCHKISWASVTCVMATVSGRMQLNMLAPWDGIKRNGIAVMKKGTGYQYQVKKLLSS